ncbi:MAG: DUF2258 domain-containing protein [Thaumarchaeota archaeon]|nr:MAG: DUF2258 domain-containing protein [Nitrososphaerota archaeon]
MSWMSGEGEGGERFILRTGIVVAGAYADRVRRVLFAQLSQKIKSGELDSKEVARAAGELNTLLYDAFVRNLALSKGDLVRIEAPYTISNGRIVWDLRGLRVRAFREIGEEVVEKAVEEALKAREAQQKETVQEHG